MDEVRANASKDSPWPQHVFLPVHWAGKVLAAHYSAQGIRVPPTFDLVFPASVLAMFGAWRVTQGIYRYDPTLYDAIIATSLKGDIPIQVLQHMPEWCVYVETPGLVAPVREGTEQPLSGVWAWWDWGPRENDHHLMALGFHVPTLAREVSIMYVPMIEGITLDGAVDMVIKGWREAAESGVAPEGPPENYAKVARPQLEKILSLLLYICSDGADHCKAGTTSTYPEPTRTRHGLRHFPVDKPMVWDVGVRLGSALRRAAARALEDVQTASGDRRRPRFHVRNFHWHTFRTGPGRMGRRVKWLPPIPVNPADYELLPSTIRTVEEGEL
jgi:hypothetical protein